MQTTTTCPIARVGQVIKDRPKGSDSNGMFILKKRLALLLPELKKARS